MRPALWFVVPAHGRIPLTRICLTQLRRTCDQLEQEGIDATAIVIADDENLDTARDLGFGTYRRNNYYLSRKFNDGIQCAMDPEHNLRPADYVVPCGSDDWVDHRLFLRLPPPDTIYAFQHMAFVREDGRELTTRFLNYEGGCGIRIYPRQVMSQVGYRPADEDRRKGCDTSIFVNLWRNTSSKIEHRPLDALQIVDWKSTGENLNSYEGLRRYQAVGVVDPFEVLADRYPSEALDEMRAHYGMVLA